MSVLLGGIGRMNKESRWVPRHEMPVSEYIKLKAEGNIQRNVFGEELLLVVCSEDEYREMWRKAREQSLIARGPIW